MFEHWKKHRAHWERMVHKRGADILKSANMQKEKKFLQHGKVSVYTHSVRVAVLSLFLAELLRVKVNEEVMMRGALLHDYFLYDWHEADKSHRFHGFIHAGRALLNAEKDFELSDIERNMIKSHMFPLNPVLPRYRESVILCVADKICAARETGSGVYGKARRTACRTASAAASKMAAVFPPPSYKSK